MVKEMKHVVTNKGSNTKDTTLTKQYQKEREQKVLNDEYERVIEKYRSSNIKVHEISKLNRIITEYKANDELRHEINEKEDHIKRLQKRLDGGDDHDANVSEKTDDEAEELVNFVALIESIDEH
eukprot:240360_1